MDILKSSKNRIVLVVGAFGKSGIAVIDYLTKKNYKIKAVDRKKHIPETLMKYKGIVDFYNDDTDINLLQDIDFVVISPGVSNSNPIIAEAHKNEIPIYSEIELAYQEFPHNWIGITGTDGKSTTTSLVGEILKTEKKNVIVGGNIGNPLVDKVSALPSDTIVVAELSSFQLENIIEFKPYIGVLLNIAPDHLDRYNNMEEYIDAKFNLFKNQTANEFSVFNLKDTLISNRLEKIKSEKYFFSSQAEVRQGAFFKDSKFIWSDNGKKEAVADESDMRIYGEHNKENTLSAITVAKLLNISNDGIKKGIRNFKGLEHRMEFITEIGGRRFINDSKATTVSAVKMSVSSIDGKGIVILGGRDKGLDFSSLSETLNRKAKFVLLIGEAKEKIKSQIDFDKERIIEVDSLDDAVKESYNVSEVGDTIILSPGCSSFDMFKNFEERGRVFKKKVLELKEAVNE